MTEFDVFRRDLGAALLDCADRRRRRSRAAGEPTGEDLKIIALVERLAADVENLDPHVVLSFERMFPPKQRARGVLQRHEDLFAQVGALYCPSSATDLVRWLTSQTEAGDRHDRSSHVRARCAAVARPSPDGRRWRGSPAKRVSPPALPASVTSDFSACFGIVAPLLAVWEVGLAIGQWRDQATLKGHAAVPATVISSEPSAGIRNSGLSTELVLSFRPSVSSEACQVPVRVSHLP